MTELFFPEGLPLPFIEDIYDRGSDDSANHEVLIMIDCTHDGFRISSVKFPEAEEEEGGGRDSEHGEEGIEFHIHLGHPCNKRDDIPQMKRTRDLHAPNAILCELKSLLELSICEEPFP